jgi:hypothetical protein
MGCKKPKSDKKMIVLTHWDETTELKELKKSLMEIRDMYDNTEDAEERRLIIVKYDSITANISEEMLDRWFR